MPHHWKNRRNTCSDPLIDKAVGILDGGLAKAQPVRQIEKIGDNEETIRTLSDLFA